MFSQIIPDSLSANSIQNILEKKSAQAFAPSNIALIKYWGKRDEFLNLPLTDSLSISLDLLNLGTQTEIKISHKDQKPDSLSLNNQELNLSSPFAQRLFNFLKPFRFNLFSFQIKTYNTVPTAAGLASSASGYAALVKALDLLFDFNLNTRDLSILARLGSGSAARSIETGFVHWHAGILNNGMDSYAEKIADPWPELAIHVLLINSEEKKISSREAMKITKETSKIYKTWPESNQKDLHKILTAIHTQDFKLLGDISEQNALLMHETMADSQPSICFSTPETLRLREQIWKLRSEGLNIYFTQDAGPNLKLIYEKKDLDLLKNIFKAYWL